MQLKTSHDNGFNQIVENSNFDLQLNYHNHSSPIYDTSLLNQQTEFNNRIKNTIKIQHNLAEIDLPKIFHDLKYLISAYDTIVGWVTRWNSNNVIFDSGSSYKFKKRDQLLNDLATRYDMTNMKPNQLDLQLQNSTMDSEITTKVS